MDRLYYFLYYEHVKYTHSLYVLGETDRGVRKGHVLPLWQLQGLVQKRPGILKFVRRQIRSVFLRFRDTVWSITLL